jgi:hypothetical protein
MQKVEKIIEICMLNSNEEYRDQFKQFQKQHCKNNNNNHLSLLNDINSNLSNKISTLKDGVEDFKKFFLYKQEEVRSFFKLYQKNYNYNV